MKWQNLPGGSYLRSTQSQENEMDDNVRNVSIVDIKMPFMSMVVFMVKAAIAAIPATIILVFIAAVVFGLITGLGTQ